MMACSDLCLIARCLLGRAVLILITLILIDGSRLGHGRSIGTGTPHRGCTFHPFIPPFFEAIFTHLHLLLSFAVA